MKRKALVIAMGFITVVFVLTACTAGQKELTETTGSSESYSSEAGGESTLNSDNATEKQDTSSKSEKTDASEGSQESETKPNDADATTEGGSNENTVKVIFQDEDGNVLKSDDIEKGEAATPPDDPEKDGYKFKGWNYDYEDVQTDITVIPVFEEITEPSIVVKNITAGAGDKIDVVVSVVNNPGFLGMVTNIQYDEGALELTDVSNGSIMGDYTFTPPKNMKSGCNAAWNINDKPEGELNGEIMVLHFKVLSKVTSGNYSVSVTCMNNAFDDSYNAFSFDTVSGSVKIR